MAADLSGAMPVHAGRIAGDTISIRLIRRPEKVRALRRPGTWAARWRAAPRESEGTQWLKGRSSALAGSVQVPPRRYLGAEASAALCDGLVAELNALQGGEDAALWAFRSLPDEKTALRRPMPSALRRPSGTGWRALGRRVRTGSRYQMRPFPRTGSGSRRGARRFSAPERTVQAAAEAQVPVAIQRDRQDRFGIAGAAPCSGPRPRPVRRQRIPA